MNAIKALQVARVPLQVSKIGSDHSEATKQIILRATGHEVNGRALVASAKWTLGSWDLALKAAGINPGEIRLQKYRWQGRTILRAIRRLHQYDVPLNVGNIKSGDPKSSAILKLEIGRDIGTPTLYHRAVRKFGSWDEALRLAKINPDEIRLKSRPTSNISITPHQEEWGKANGGIWRKQVYFGTPAKTPEQLLEENEDQETLQKAIRSLSPEDQTFIEGALSSNVDFMERGELRTEAGKSNPSKSRFAEILARLKTNLLFIREMEEIHQLLFSYLPTGCEKTMLEILVQVDAISSRLENRESVPEIGQTLRTLEDTFAVFFSTVQSTFGFSQYSARSKILHLIP